jgi:hypothetical protein
MSILSSYPDLPRWNISNLSMTNIIFLFMNHLLDKINPGYLLNNAELYCVQVSKVNKNCITYRIWLSI